MARNLWLTYKTVAIKRPKGMSDEEADSCQNVLEMMFVDLQRDFQTEVQQTVDPSLKVEVKD